MLRPDDILYGLPIKEIARICKVDLTTARRWKRGAKCPPQTALMVLSGDLGWLDPAWEGWRLVGGRIVSPEGWAATPGDVMMVQLAQMTLATYREENRQLKQRLAALEYEEQPVPSSNLPEIKVR